MDNKAAAMVESEGTNDDTFSAMDDKHLAEKEAEARIVVNSMSADVQKEMAQSMQQLTASLSEQIQNMALELQNIKSELYGQEGIGQMSEQLRMMELEMQMNMNLHGELGSAVNGLHETNSNDDNYDNNDNEKHNLEHVNPFAPESTKPRDDQVSEEDIQSHTTAPMASPRRSAASADTTANARQTNTESKSKANIKSKTNVDTGVRNPARKPTTANSDSGSGSGNIEKTRMKRNLYKYRLQDPDADEEGSTIMIPGQGLHKVQHYNIDAIDFSDHDLHRQSNNSKTSHRDDADMGKSPLPFKSVHHLEYEEGDAGRVMERNRVRREASKQREKKNANKFMYSKLKANAHSGQQKKSFRTVNYSRRNDDDFVDYDIDHPARRIQHPHPHPPARGESDQDGYVVVDDDDYNEHSNNVNNNNNNHNNDNDDDCHYSNEHDHDDHHHAEQNNLRDRRRRRRERMEKRRRMREGDHGDTDDSDYDGDKYYQQRRYGATKQTVQEPNQRFVDRYDDDRHATRNTANAHGNDSAKTSRTRHGSNGDNAHGKNEKMDSNRRQVNRVTQEDIDAEIAWERRKARTRAAQAHAQPQTAKRNYKTDGRTGVQNQATGLTAEEQEFRAQYEKFLRERRGQGSKPGTNKDPRIKLPSPQEEFYRRMASTKKRSKRQPNQMWYWLVATIIMALVMGPLRPMFTVLGNFFSAGVWGGDGDQEAENEGW